MEEEKNKLLFLGLGGNKKKKQETRTPIENPEGVEAPGYPRDPGLKQKGVLSLTQIELLDLIGEGKISGIVDTEYTFQGSVGNVGWTSATPTYFNWLRSIYWNEVPVMNNLNQYNFSNVSIAVTPGVENGTTSARISNALTISRQVGERLRAGDQFVKIYRILNPACRAVEVNVKVTNLSRINQSEEEAGDIEDAVVNFEVLQKPIYATPGKTPTWYAYPQYDRIYGKISQGYIRSLNVPLYGGNSSDPDFLGWEIKIRRDTPDSITAAVRNQTYIDSLTEIYGDVYKYPCSAIVSAKFSAENFSQIPSRIFDARLLLVKVPNNYNPILKTYDGDWDGGWKEDANGFTDKQWTDNPAWCFYDLLTNKRYGLGKYIGEEAIDKWTLYEIAKYCDTLVPDGFGGIEPRFTCNLVLTSREDAYKVVNDMASIFRAMTYYAAGTIQTSQDSSKNSLFHFTNANVEGGDFSYSSTSKRVRHTVAIVRYNDKNNFYKPAVEYVEDVDGIRRYGIRELEVTAFGCTSRGQAVRLGKWALLSNTLETESINFSAGMDASYLRPGDVFSTFDQNRKGKRYGGRTHSIYHEDTFSTVVLDDKVDDLSSSSLYTFSLLTPTYFYDTSSVEGLTSADASNVRRNQIQKLAFASTQVSGVSCEDGIDRTYISFSGKFNVTDYSVSGNLPWTMEASGTGLNTINNALYDQLDYWRAIRIEEKDDKYAIVGIQYEEQKFRVLESGLAFEAPTYTQVPTGPSNLQLIVSSPTSYSRIISYSFTMSDLTAVNGYKVYAKTSPFASSDFDNDTYLIAVLPKETKNGSYFPTSNGVYYFRVYSVNSVGTKSTSFAGGNITVAGINIIKEIQVSSLRLTTDSRTTNAAGIISSGVFDDKDPEFTWQVGINTSLNLNESLAYRVTFREHSDSNKPSTHIYYEETGWSSNASNFTYEFDFADNMAAVSNRSISGPFRDFDIVVEAMTYDGKSSAGGNFLTDGDSDYSNANGYDIYHAYNPRFTGAILTTEWASNLEIYTDQWITPDGDIKISISGDVPQDIAGGYLYVSDTQFSEGQAKGFLSFHRPITKIKYDQLANPQTIAANLLRSNSAWIAVSPYDFFDEALLTENREIYQDLDMSNVVEVRKRGAFMKDDFLFHAWMESDLDYRISSVDDSFWSTSAGISAIIPLQYETTWYDASTNTNKPITAFTHNFMFDKPLGNNLYGVVNNGVTGVERPGYVPVQVVKFNTHVQLYGPYQGKFFFGVLRNSTYNPNE
jgi:predicted phage tail protein